MVRETGGGLGEGGEGGGKGGHVFVFVADFRIPLIS